MRSRTFVTLAVLAGLLLIHPTLAATPSKAEVLLRQRMAAWAIQSKAAEADRALVTKTLKEFYSLGGVNEPTSITAVDAALAPLRARFPDYRLKYRGKADLCPVMAAIRNAQQDAIQRQLEAVNHEIRLGQQVTLRLLLSMGLTRAKYLDGPFDEKHIDAAFAENLNDDPVPVPETRFSFNNYRSKPLSEVCD